MQNRCEIRNDSAPDSRGSLRVVAHVAQWIERLPPEQKVVGPIPTVGARKVIDTLVIKNHSHEYVHGTKKSASNCALDVSYPNMLGLVNKIVPLLQTGASIEIPENLL